MKKFFRHMPPTIHDQHTNKTTTNTNSPSSHSHRIGIIIIIIQVLSSPVVPHDRTTATVPSATVSTPSIAPHPHLIEVLVQYLQPSLEHMQTSSATATPSSDVLLAVEYNTQVSSLQRILHLLSLHSVAALFYRYFS